jgi:hypothetical protein
MAADGSRVRQSLALLGKTFTLVRQTCAERVASGGVKAG